MLSLGMAVPGGVGGVGGMMLPGGLQMPLPPLPLGAQGMPGLAMPGMPGGMPQLAGMQLPFGVGGPMVGGAAGPGGLAAGANVGVGVNGVALPMPMQLGGVGAPMPQMTPAQLSSQIGSLMQVR